MIEAIRRVKAIQPVRSELGFQLLASLLAVTAVFLPMAVFELTILAAGLPLPSRLAAIVMASLLLLVAFLALAARILQLAGLVHIVEPLLLEQLFRLEEPP